MCISRKICSYVRANCAKGSAFLPSSLYLCLLLHSSFFTRLVPFSSSLSRPLSPSNLSVFLFSPSRRPLFNFRSLSHDASIVYLSLPLSFFVSSSFCTCSLREREREGGDTGEHLPTIYFLYRISALSKWLSLVTSERKCSRYADRDSSLIYGALCLRCNLLELSITRVCVCMYHVEATNDFHWNFVLRVELPG